MFDTEFQNLDEYNIQSLLYFVMTCLLRCARNKLVATARIVIWFAIVKSPRSRGPGTFLVALPNH